MATMTSDHRAEQVVMPLQRSSHQPGLTFPQHSRPLDVGKQKVAIPIGSIGATIG